MLTQRPTPAFMSQEAARKLPRLALLALLAAFILSGLWAQDFWTLRDAEAFGIAREMLSGDASALLLPQIAGEALPYAGPAAPWAAAFFMKLFSGLLGEVGAYRLTSLFWFALSTAALWYGTWRLARRSEAQPVAFAFGGEAEPRQYGRAVADCAVLLFVATFGIFARQHEPVAGTVLLACASCVFFGIALTLRRPEAGAFVTGLASGFAALTTSVVPGLWLMGGAVLVHAFARTFPGSRDRRILTLLAGAALPVVVWLGLVLALTGAEGEAWLAAWAAEEAERFDLVEPRTVLWMIRTSLWFLLPAWPLALWALYSWRRQIDRTQILVPAVFVVTALSAGLFTAPAAAESLLLAAVPGFVVLGAFGLITLRQSRENLLDWFAISVFSVALAALWLYWFANLLGFPPKMARSIQMLSPGVTAEFGLGFVLPVLALVLWVVFVVWRLTHRPIVVWRGPWLAASGMTAAAVTLCGLWHTAIDINRSYAAPAKTAAAEAVRITGRPAPLVDGAGLPAGVRALFAWYGPVRFTRPGEAGDVRLVRTRSDEIPADAVSVEISRPHTNESFYLVPANRR